MKKRAIQAGRLLLPVFLLAVALVVYQILNGTLFVRWLGCGCSDAWFNANRLSEAVISALCLASLIGAAQTTRRLTSRTGKILYILIAGGAILALSALFLLTFRWR